MKPQLTLVALFLFFGTLTAQVKFKVKLLNDNQTYQVLFKPETTWNTPLSTTSSSQVSIRVPVGGFSAGNIVSQKGTWKLQGTVTSPVEAPGFTYLNFGLEAAIPGSQIAYVQGVEIPMFTFRNNGTCSGTIEIIDNNTDPFLPPNSQNLNIGNSLAVLGAGAGVNAYIGNYTSFDADCMPIGDCEIEVYDVALVSPSTCGLANGSITIDATHSGGTPLSYTINYGSPQTVWQSSPTFTGLPAGDTYYLAVTDENSFCLVELGGFELEGPLAAIVQSIDLVDPACGETNGSITINAVSANGGAIEFAMNQNGPWQASHTFSGLAEGSYSFWVRNAVNNCQNFVGTYTLDGCVAPDCILTYDLQYLGNGRYEVNMLTDTTWNPPFNTTSSLQVTVKVPTGGFIVSNVASQLPNVDFTLGSIQTSPTEDPAYDYISFILNSPGTTNIPYVDGNTLHLFTFENTGTCTGDSIRLMLANDPFTPPNSQNANVGQQISVAGYGSADAPICIGNNAALCEAVLPVPPTCLLTYELEELAGDVFQVSIISDTTWNAPWNFVSNAQVTVKVPAGGFVVSDLTDMEGDWEIGAEDDEPAEDPTSDYITFILAIPSNLDVFQNGTKTPIFTFKNSGTCQGEALTLMDNENDPFYPPNSANSNVGQYISVAGSQGEDILICLSILPTDDCYTAPCAGLVADFGAPDGCLSVAIAFTDSTIANETITSWSWNFGDGSALGTAQNPSHVFSSSGNFEVSLTVTTQSGCTATFMDFVTVFPTPSGAPISSYTICNGVGVVLETQDNITTATWSPTTGLDLTDPFAPFANPANTTIYTLTVTNSNGCVNTSQVTVNVLSKPVLSNVTVTSISDCGLTDASIQISALGAGAIQYGLDNGNGIIWQAGGTFGNLAAGSYNAYVRNGDGSCPVAYNGNPIIITAPTAPTIVSVTQVQPTGCDDDGSIIIDATGGTPPLQYSITGLPPFQASNVFNNLGSGTYNIMVTNANGACATVASPVVFTQPTPPTIVTPVADQNLCVGSSTNVSIQLSDSFASYNITGTGVYSNASVNGNTLNFTATANAVGQTTYNVELVQANGCSATESFTLTGVAVPTASFTISPVVCTNGDVVLNFTGTSNLNATLIWALAGAQVINASQQSPTAPANATMVVSWDAPGAKAVTLSVDNGGCVVTNLQTINVTDFNPAATFANTSASCGLNNGAINLTVTGSGYSYNWSNSTTIEDPTGLVGGNYFVTITHQGSGCQSTASTTVSGSPAVAISNVSTVPATQCTGSDGDGSLTVQISGGTGPVYTFSIAGQTPISGALTTATFNDLTAGAYTVTVSDSQGCTDVETVAIGAVNSQLSLSVTTVDAGCTTSNGSLTASVSGGQAPYTYSLLQDNNGAGSGLPVNGATLTLSNLIPANYTIVFEDANGCIAAGSGVVERTEGVFTAIETITPAGCGASNGAILLSGVPASATIVWSTGSAANPLTGLVAGVYTATITETSGCTSSKTFAVTTSGGQTVAISLLNSASCGLANGSVRYIVIGGSAFSYHVLGANLPSGFGTPGVQDTITGLAAGTYVLEITDLNQPGCKVYQPFTVLGSDALLTSTTVQFATGCGNNDGEICITIEGGQAPYALAATAGTVIQGNAANEFCVTGLYEGIVEVEINDDNGCSKIIAQDMGDFAEPNITLDSVQITDPTCPGELGAIVSLSASQYLVLNSANSVVGLTPWAAAPSGDYTLILTINGCTDSLAVTVGGPDDWGVVSTIEHDSCSTTGSIALAVTGGTAPYTVIWSNNATDTTITSLVPGTYTVTITDAEGCTHTSASVVEDHCEGMTPCPEDEIFYIDTFIVQLTASLTEICLPTNLTNLQDYNLQLNDEAYNRTIGNCGSTTTFYDGFDILPTTPPYVLQSWEHHSPGNFLTNFQFNSIEELLAKMKEVDGAGNWAYDAGSIFGGEATALYGNMRIQHLQSGSMLDLPPSKLIVPHPTVLVDNNRIVHMLVATSPDNANCIDTLFINLLEPDPAQIDTILVQVPVGEYNTICIPIDELVGSFASLGNECISGSNNAQINTTGTPCVEVEGLDIGSDEACIVICDDLGFCDTTILLIDVIDGSTHIQVMTGFSPNGDGMNEVFMIKNIDLYPDNDLLVFNRWGKSVFKRKGYQNSWDGEYRNTKLPDGSYFYILNVKENGKDKEYKGFVEIRR